MTKTCGFFSSSSWLVPSLVYEL